MRIFRRPLFNGIFTLSLSAMYGFIFMFIRNHIEFLRLLPKTNKPTLQSPYWNGWLELLRAGNIHYIVIVLELLTLIICGFIAYAMIQKKTGKLQYDEYQTSIISKALIISGISAIICTPFLLIQYLSDPNYGIPFLFNYAIFQWGIYLVVNLFYTIKFHANICIATKSDG